MPDLFDLDFGETNQTKAETTSHQYGIVGPDENIQKLNEIMNKMNIDK